MLRNRLIWLFLWILSMVSITFYGGAISYGFFITITFVPIASLIYLLMVYTFFRIYQNTEGRDFVVNQVIPFSFSLVNDYFFPFVGVRVKFFSSFSTINGLSDDIEYELMPGTSIDKETNLICHYRGEYKVGIKSVEIQDYFRLFKISYRNKSDKTVIIRPQLLHLDRIGDFDVNRSIRDSKASQSENDLLSREYINGDDTRLINWNQSARAGKLMVRNKIGQDKQGVSIIVDTCRYSKNDLLYIPVENKILELTLAISLYLSERRIPVSEYHFNRKVVNNIIHSKDQFDDFYKRTSEMIFDKDNTNQSLFEELQKCNEIFRSEVTFIVVSKWNQDVDAMINKLAENSVYAVVFLVGDKDEIPDYLDQAKVKIFYVSPKESIEEVLS